MECREAPEIEFGSLLPSLEEEVGSSHSCVERSNRSKGVDGVTFCPGALMWRIQELEARAVELDFRSSGQGRRNDTSLVADGCRLVNAASLVDFDPASDRVQVEVCEACGTTQCAQGGWISLRRLGAEVLWLPAFQAMSDEQNSAEFAPPRYMSQAGLPLFSEATYSTVRRHVGDLPALADIQPLDSRELALILQWEAPGSLLGSFPDPPRFRRDTVLAVDHGDVTEHVTTMVELLGRALDGAGMFTQSTAAPAVSFYLDLPGYPTWSPLVLCGRTWGLHLGAELNVLLGDAWG